MRERKRTSGTKKDEHTKQEKHKTERNKQRGLTDIATGFAFGGTHQ
jgi:hypothetical protein